MVRTKSDWSRFWFKVSGFRINSLMCLAECVWTWPVCLCVERGSWQDLLPEHYSWCNLNVQSSLTSTTAACFKQTTGLPMRATQVRAEALACAAGCVWTWPVY